MKVQNADELAEKKCVPCQSGTTAYSASAVAEQLRLLPGWYATHEGARIRKDWKVKNFLAGLEFFNAVAPIAEEDEHHPDLHLEDYKNLSIEIWTHTIGGISENDFILAAKIDRVSLELE